MHDPMTVLASGKRWVLWHRDRKGVDGACKRRVMRKPYNCTDNCDLPPVPMPKDWTYCTEQKRFLHDLHRARRRRWLHLHHWRITFNHRTSNPNQCVIARTSCCRYIRKRLRDNVVFVGLRPDGYCTAPLTAESHDAAFRVRWARFGFVGLRMLPRAKVLRPPEAVA